MTYEPKLGDYGTVSTNGCIGFLIQVGTQSKDNHAFIYLGSGKIIEATPRHGVIISDVSKYQNIVWNRHETLTDDQRKAIVNEALKHIGDPYFFQAFALIGLRILGIDLPRFLIGNLEKSKGLICSELVSIAYRKGANIIVVEGKPDYFVTPADLTYRLLYQ